MSTAETTTVYLDDIPSMIRWIEDLQKRDKLDIRRRYLDKKEGKRSASELAESRVPIVYADIGAGLIEARIPGHVIGGKAVSVIVDCSRSNKATLLAESGGENGPRSETLDYVRPLLPPVIYADLERWTLAIRPRCSAVDGMATLVLMDAEPFAIKFEIDPHDSLKVATVDLSVSPVIDEDGSMLLYHCDACVRTITDSPEDFREVIEGYDWESIGATVVFGSPPVAITSGGLSEPIYSIGAGEGVTGYRDVLKLTPVVTGSLKLTAPMASRCVFPWPWRTLPCGCGRFVANPGVTSVKCHKCGFEGSGS